MEEKEKVFGELYQSAMLYIRKYGNPHMTIIITQNGIEILQGEKAEPFELND